MQVNSTNGHGTVVISRYFEKVTCKRVLNVALPFISLYKPLSTPVTLLRGSISLWDSCTVLKTNLKDRKKLECVKNVYDIAFIIAQTVVPIFHPKFGFRFFQGYELLSLSIKVVKEMVSEKNCDKDAEILNTPFVKIWENPFKISAIAIAMSSEFYNSEGLPHKEELTVLSKTVQVIKQCVDSYINYEKDLWLESVGKIAMGAIQTYKALPETNPFITNILPDNLSIGSKFSIGNLTRGNQFMLWAQKSRFFDR